MTEDVVTTAQPKTFSKRLWWCLIGMGIAALWMPRWIQIPVLIFVAGALGGSGDLLLTKKDRSDNALAWLFFKAALWFELFVWLFPASHEFVARWHLHSTLEFVLSAIGVTVLWFFIQLVASYALLAVFAAVGMSLVAASNVFKANRSEGR